MKSLFALALLFTLTAEAATLRSLRQMSNPQFESVIRELNATFAELPVEGENSEAYVSRWKFTLTNPAETRESTLKQIIHLEGARARNYVDSVTVKRTTLRQASNDCELIVFGALSFVDNPMTQMEYFGSILYQILRNTRNLEYHKVSARMAFGVIEALAIVDVRNSEIVFIGTQFVE
jgi:hypothetical protein